MCQWCGIVNIYPPPLSLCLSSLFTTIYFLCLTHFPVAARLIEAGFFFVYVCSPLSGRICRSSGGLTAERADGISRTKERVKIQRKSNGIGFFGVESKQISQHTHTHTHTHTHKTKSKSQFCDRISTVLRKMGGKKWVKSNQPLAGRTCRNTAGSRRADYTQHMYEIASCIKELEHMKPSRQRAFSLFFFSFYIGWVLRNRIKKGTCGSITSMVNFCFKTHQNAWRWISSR
jgi:hypothetical protein